MKDMFHNYDYNINKKETCRKPSLWQRNLDKDLTGYSNMQMLYNYKGEFIGVSAKQGCPIDLYFSIEGTVDDSADFVDKISDLCLAIYDHNHTAVITRVPNLIEDEINFHISDTEAAEKLKHGVYTMKLTAVIDNEEFQLFSENDGILEVI